MSAPAISPLYDLELERLLDDEAKCRACAEPAVALLSHAGKCATPPSLMCSGHAADQRRALDRAIKRRMHTVCVDCRALVPATAWTIRPI